MASNYDMSPPKETSSSDSQQQFGLPMMPTFAEKADIFEKMRPEEVLTTISLRLRGFKQNDKTGEWEQPQALQKTAITEKGAHDLANLALSVLTKSLTITTLDMNEIRFRQLEITKALMAKIITNWKEYNIVSVDQIRAIKVIITTQTFLALKEAYNAGARGVIKGTSQESRMIIDNPMYNKPSLSQNLRNKIFGV